jgi:hypothetical protein
MRNTHIHFEQVPIEVVEKILEQQIPSAKRNGNRKLVVKKSRKMPSGPHRPGKESEVPVL